jgi:hypothetical protein
LDSQNGANAERGGGREGGRKEGREGGREGGRDVPVLGLLAQPFRSMGRREGGR